MLVVDFMHEIELGVWKSLLVHLLRILSAVNPNLLHELDNRQVVSFRGFSNSLKHMIQIQTSSDFRQRYHPKIYLKHFGIEENGGTKL